MNTTTSNSTKVANRPIKKEAPNVSIYDFVVDGDVNDQTVVVKKKTDVSSRFNVKRKKAKEPGNTGDGSKANKVKPMIIDLQQLQKTTYFYCSICGRRFDKSTYLKQHLSMHKGEKKFPCTYCGKSFVQQSNLICHIRIHTGQKPYQCECCDKSFNQSGNLISHLRSHSGDKPYECVDCEKRFARSTDLVRHTRTHTGAKPYSCDFCLKSFTHSASLAKHKRNETCLKVKISKADLGKDRIWTCKICSKEFEKETYLTIHLRTHSGVKPFTCEVCDKSFAQGGHLKSHLKIHTGEKSYNCEICDRNFACSTTFRRHKVIHTNDKSYHCNYEGCSKAFSQRSTLISHTKTHTGARPFSCSHCKKKFTHAGSRNRHAKKCAFLPEESASGDSDCTSTTSAQGGTTPVKGMKHAKSTSNTACSN